MEDTVPLKAETLKAHLTEQTEKWRVVTNPGYCTVHGYHVAAAFDGRYLIDMDREESWASGESKSQVGRGKYPIECECGFVFGPDDRRIRLCFPVMRLPDGRETIYRRLPFNCQWEDMESD